MSHLKKAATKEGGKLGMDLTGSAELGGTEFFCTTVQSAEGDMDALMAARDALIEECKVVGVLLFSAGKDLACCAIVPEDKAEVIAADEWLTAALKPLGAQIEEGATKTFARALVVPAEGQFAIKMKDQALAAGVALLREKGKIPDDDDDDDEGVCFGDDDIGNF